MPKKQRFSITYVADKNYDWLSLRSYGKHVENWTIKKKNSRKVYERTTDLVWNHAHIRRQDKMAEIVQSSILNDIKWIDI